jgi:hypothetical protein
VVVMAVCLLSCSGCQSSGGVTPTSAPATTAAREISEPSAVNEAKRVYLNYLKVSDRISENGGRGVEELAAYVSASDLARERKSAGYLQEHGLRIVGTSRLLKFAAQRVDSASRRATAYACVDFSRTKVLDKAGKDVTPRDRADRQTTVAEFVRIGDRFVVNENKPWSGKSIC